MATALGTLLNTQDTEWIGVIHEQAPKFFRGYADETIRNRVLLAYLRKYGRIELSQNSPMCVWNIRYNQQPITAAGDAGTLVFNRWDLQRQAALNWRGYVGTDALTEKEYLMNQGPSRILNRYAEVIPSLMEAMTDNFGRELIAVNGNAAGFENNVHGLESIFPDDGTTVSADLIALPSTSYAGLSTVLQSEGGTWTSLIAAGSRPKVNYAYDWPAGRGSVPFDFFSPKLINWSSTSWGTGAATWEANCERVIRQGIIWLTNTGGQNGRPKVVLLSQGLYNGFLNHQSMKMRIIVPHKESEDLGFDGTVNFEGVGLMYDFEVPPQTGYMMNVANMNLASLDKVLFGYRGPDWSIRDRAYLFYTGFWGNLKYRPKHFSKLYAYA